MKKKQKFKCIQSSIQNEGIRTFFPIGYFGLEGIRKFGLKNQTIVIDKIDKYFELYQVFMCQIVLIFRKIYTIYQKN